MNTDIAIKRWRNRAGKEGLYIPKAVLFEPRYSNDAIRIYGLLLMSTPEEPADIELLQIKAGLNDNQRKWEAGINSLVKGDLLAIEDSNYYIGNKEFSAKAVKAMWEAEDVK